MVKIVYYFSVHTLHPSDISVVAAMGDFVTVSRPWSVFFCKVLTALSQDNFYSAILHSQFCICYGMKLNHTVDKKDAVKAKLYCVVPTVI